VVTYFYSVVDHGKVDHTQRDDGERLNPRAGEKIPGGNEIWIPGGDGDPFFNRRKGSPASRADLRPVGAARADGTGHKLGTGLKQRDGTRTVGRDTKVDVEVKFLANQRLRRT